MLVSCYELGHQPLSLASPLAALAEAGIPARALDTAVEPFDCAAARDARLVAISAPMHTALRLGQQVARGVRSQNPEAHITFYGLYAWLNAEHLFQAGLADSVIGGEFEPPLVALATNIPLPPQWETRGQGPPALPGVRFPDQPAPPYLEHHPWPVPQRHTLSQIRHYAHLLRDGQAVPAGYVEATRGCKHTCAHCPITPVYQGRFLAVPRETVLADIEAQVAMGARHITFGDPDFLNGPTHSLKLVRAMHASFPDVTFDATIKIEHILRHAELFPELRELGCAFVLSAVESLSEEVLRRLRKGHTAHDVNRALDVMERAGIPLRPSLVAFTPWTTLGDYVAMLEFVRSHGLVDSIDPVQYAIRLLIPPASALLEDAGTWLGELDASALSYRWTHPDRRLDELHAQVSAIVECGELEGRDVWETFAAIRSAAQRLAGIAQPPDITPPAERRRPPRLTESWFC
ncbi:MAG TPA: CUAEP/CCAEP-tail radical SAM protein [Chloroflexota bacterium]